MIIASSTASSGRLDRRFKRRRPTHRLTGSPRQHQTGKKMR